MNEDEQLLYELQKKLETKFSSDVIVLYSQIVDDLVKPFRTALESLNEQIVEEKVATIILNTPGGSAEVVEQLVNLIRHFYSEVNFVVPDGAYSAGTILCMSGDRIFMDYSSSLGPIDPQVQAYMNGVYDWVPALGYLSKVAELVKKSEDNTITEAELAILLQIDLAVLDLYEQARELAVQLTQDWLAKYKFKRWKTHETNPKKKGKVVTNKQKKIRARTIAKKLSDHKRWHSHSRSININTLQNELKLKIENYSDDIEFRKLIREYDGLASNYMNENELSMFVQTRINIIKN